MHRHQLELDFHGAARVARDGRHTQLVHQAGGDVGGDAHIALAATQHQRHGGRVITRVHRKTLGHVADQPLRTLDVARGFLDTHDAGHLRQAQHGVVGHIGHGAAGHVVKHRGQVAHRFGDGLEMLVLALLCGLVVVGHHLQLAVGTDALGKLGQLDGFLGGIGAAAGHDGHTFGGLLYRHADDLAVLFDIHRRRLTRGAHHADAVRAFGDVPVDQFAQGGVIHAAVFVHRGHQGHDAASNGAG